MSAAAAMASVAFMNTAKNESPSVETSIPACPWNAARTIRW